MVFLTKVEVARAPICVKDTVSYETGEWKYPKLLYEISSEEMDTSVWGRSIPKINKICVLVESRSNTEKALLTSKCNSLLLFLE